MSELPGETLTPTAGSVLAHGHDQHNQGNQYAQGNEHAQGNQDGQGTRRKKFENKESKLHLNAGEIRVLIAAILLDPKGFADHVKPSTSKLAESCGYKNANTANSIFYYAKEKVRLIAERGGEGALAINAVEIQPKQVSRHPTSNTRTKIPDGYVEMSQNGNDETSEWLTVEPRYDDDEDMARISSDIFTHLAGFHQGANGYEE